MANKDDIMAPDTKAFPGAIKEYVPNPELVKEVEEILVKIRVRLLILQPFWGQLACHLQLQDASGWCPTAATDGRHFYFNVNFIKSLSDKELVFLFAHEIMHVAYNHFLRREGRDPKLWNASADYAINGELVECKVGDMPKMGLYDKKFLVYNKENQFKDTWGSEKIYDFLYENAEKMNMPLDTLDVHMDPDDGSGEGDADCEGSEYQPGDENSAPKISKNAAEKIAKEMKNAIIQAAQAEQSSSKTAGTMPVGLQRLIKSWTQPKIKWTDLIETNLKSQIKNDFTYMKVNRRGELPGGIIMPGWDTEEMIRAHVSIDTSGSMTNEMLMEIVSELQGIMNQFNTFELHIWCFDGNVQTKSYQVFTSENINTMSEYTLLGGGGTDFMSNWHFMRKREIEPDVLLFFTDGYPCGEWGEPNYCDTIFCIHGDHNKDIKAPFGLTVWYEDAKRNQR